MLSKKYKANTTVCVCVCMYVKMISFIIVLLDERKNHNKDT